MFVIIYPQKLFCKYQVNFESEYGTILSFMPSPKQQITLRKAISEIDMPGFLIPFPPFKDLLSKVSACSTKFIWAFLNPELLLLSK